MTDQPTLPSKPPRLAARLWEQLAAGPFRRAQEESREHQQSSPQGALDVKVIVVLLTATVSLTLLRYFGGSSGYTLFLSLMGMSRDLDPLVQTVASEATGRLGLRAYWAVSCVTAYFVIPALVVKLALREPLSDYGFRLRGTLRDSWVYGVMAVVMLPLVYVASRGAAFQSMYPFYHVQPSEPLWPKFICWEVLYAAQFVALEFFFRGFLLHGTRRRFGFYSVFVMTVPYCMIHYGKPFPEAMAAIIAGVVLGVMSLKTRSIWWGAALHIAVAWSMDWAALWRKGLLE